jgi:quinoprotein glucose dehydrogenase
MLASPRVYFERLRHSAPRGTGGSMKRQRVGCRATAVAALCLAASAQAQDAPAGTEWRHYSGDAGSSKYSPLAQIDATNVGRLRIAWRRPALDAAVLAVAPEMRAGKQFRGTPLKIGDVLYAPNGVGFVEAFDPGTGKTLWVEPPLDATPNGYRGASTRGLGYWADAGGRDARIFVQHTEYLLALDPKTGKPIETFGAGGKVFLSEGMGPDMRYTWTGAPFVIGDVVVLGMSPFDEFANKEATRSDVQAYDARTGKLRWTFHVIPQKGEPGVDTWENGSWEYTGHSPVWSLISGDPELGLVYLPVTAPTSDMYGGHRLGDNLFSQSIVAVEVATGKRVWHYQTVHHDLWDYDPPAAPIVMDIVVDGRARKAVTLLTKQAFAYVLDRATGEPIWPIVERPVPQSNVPGERTAATQPFPSKPPPFDLQGATEDNLIDFTPELRAEALEIVKRYTIGPLFTPPTVRDDGPGGKLGTIELPGSAGAASWTGGAFDPETKMLYVPSSYAPFVADLEPGDPARTNLRYVKGKRTWGPAGPRGLPLFKPPYGRITALNMNAGAIAWTVANGDGPRDNPAIAHLQLGPLGNTGHAAPLVTKTLLFAGEGSDAMVVRGRVPADMPLDTAPNYGEPWFRAYDKATGAVLSELELPAGMTGAPMTYLHRGKQYIVIAVGGTDAGTEWVALSLP